MTTILDYEAKTPQTSSSARGWVVTLSALSINLVLGVLYAWGVMAKALVTDWKWTKTDAALPFTVSTGAFAITMIFAGRMQDKIGPRWIAMLGGLILGAALIASSFAETPQAMLVTFGIIGGIGIGLGYSSTTPPSVKWFPPARKGLIMGIVVSGVGLAAVWIGPLTQYLLPEQKIPGTFMILGVGTIVVVCLLAQLLSNPPAGYKPPVIVAKASAEAPPSGRNLDWHEMIKTPQFFLLWLMFSLAASAGLMIIAHVPIIAKEQANLAWGFMPVAMLAIFNTCGRVVSGFLSDRIGRTHTMVLAFVLQAINMFVFRYYTTPELLMFGSAFTGLCYGTIFTLFPATTADYYGVKNLGVNYGIVFTGFGVAGVLGPIVGGMIRDRSGTYNTSYLISGGLLLVAVVLALVMRAPKTEQATA